MMRAKVDFSELEMKLESDWNYLAKVYGVDADDPDDIRSWLENNADPFYRREFLEDIKAYIEFRLQAAPEQVLGVNFDTMKTFMGKMFPFNFRFINVMKADGIQENQAGVVAVKDNKVYRVFLANITSVEDKGEYFYVGYKPRDIRMGRFGYTRVYKDQSSRQYGTLGVKRVNADGIEF